MLKWIRYSGASISVTLNPLHWSLEPFAYPTYKEWRGPNEHNWAAGWLFLTIRVWIDDGSW